MKVAFINPRIPPASMNFAFAMDLVGTGFSHPPLSLLTLAALTPADVEVSVHDENVGAIDTTLDVDIVAFTGIYCQRERLFALATSFRERGVTVVIGGPIAQDMTELCREHADVLFFGEAELTWPRFIADFASNAWESSYTQTGWVDMASSPVPRFDLIAAEDYSSACVQATRGCPYRCDYCDIPARFGSKPRSKAVEQVVEEVRLCVELGFDSVFLVDDHFAAHRRYAKTLLQALIGLQAELDRPIYFYTQATLNIARDDELLELLYRANFRRLFIGIETPDVEQLSQINKRHNLELPMLEAVAKIQSYNIIVWAGIIVGLEDDTSQSVAAQLAFIEESAIIPTLVGLLQAMPQTPLWERAQAQSRIKPLPNVVGSAAYGDIDAFGVTNLIPNGRDEVEVLRDFAWLVRRIYDPELYADRLMRATQKAQRKRPSPVDALSVRKMKIVQRTMKWYLEHPKADVRAQLQRVLSAYSGEAIQGLEEVIYHMTVFKHFHTFYMRAADIAEARAEALAQSRIGDAWTSGTPESGVQA